MGNKIRKLKKRVKKLERKMAAADEMKTAATVIECIKPKPLKYLFTAQDMKGWMIQNKRT